MDIKTIVGRLQKNLEFKIQVGSYRNLVFKGGGVRGIAYMGALQVLEEKGVLKNIQRTAGASAGAIAATLTSFRLSAAETIDLFNTLDVKKIPQNRSLQQSPRFSPVKGHENYRRLFENYGWFSSEYFYNWLQDTIALFCNGNCQATFADFCKLGHRELHVVASNLSRHRSEVFSAQTTPDTAVADAVRMSMSIPLYFECLRYDGHAFGNGDYYVDGGIFTNSPIHIFDAEPFSRSSLFFKKGVNWETLGLYLFTEKNLAEENPDMPKNLIEFVLLTGHNFYDSYEESSLLNRTIEKRRTIEISDCGISALDFEIEPGSEKCDILFKSGREAALKFLKN
jgi:NTE family protein